MTAERILDCMGMIDERFITEAEGYVPERKSFSILRFATAAACAGIIAAAAVLISRNNADISTLPDNTLYSMTETSPVGFTAVTADTSPQDGGGIVGGEGAEAAPVAGQPDEGTLQHGGGDLVTTAELNGEDNSTQPPSTETAVRVSETTLRPAETTQSTEGKETEGGGFMQEAGGYEYDETLAGISFKSFDQLQGYIKYEWDPDNAGTLEKEIAEYLSTAKGVYVIEDIAESEYVHETVKAADVNEIFITPTYTETYFSMYGAKMQLSVYHDIHSAEAGKSAYDYGVYMYENDPDKAGRFDIYDGDTLLYTVYGYETPLPDRKEFTYVWVQDGKYFSLRVNGRDYLADSAHCTAKFVPFN